MSRTLADRDATITLRASALIADPGNIGWPLALIYAVVVLLDQTIGLGARWDAAFAWGFAVELVASLAATLLLMWLAKLIYLRSGFARRHVSIMVATAFLSVLIGTVAGRIVVTSDEGAAEIARAHGCQVIDDTGTTGHSEAAMLGSRAAVEAGVAVQQPQS